MRKKIIGVTVGTPTSPKMLEKRMKPVKTVNGVAPDENGNATLTAEEVGARPDTWMPTVEEIGAAPVDDYATETYVKNAIAEAQLGGEGSDVDLSGYATKDDLRELDDKKASVNHAHNAAEVGARPDSWIPTAEDVGARPNNWMPTADEVGARSGTWLPSIAEIGAAPAGYGLGGNGAPISWADVDNVKGNGWYLVASATPITINGISFAYALLESKTFDANAGKQVLHPLFLNGVVLERYCEGNVWGIWKSPNPRMDTDVEYATTEMLNGVTIYKKRDSNGNVLYRTEGSSTWRNYADLVGAAPRGFGLGGDCVTITTLAELDATITNGWYNVKLSEPLVVSGVSISYAYMHVKGYDANWVEQEIHPMISDFTSKLVRKRHNGASWRELEWDNPPMMEGVEYRTTKRYNGKAIYTKMFTFAPSSITALNYDIPHSISNLDIGLSISVSWARGADQQRHLPSAYSENAAWNGQVFWNSNWALHFELGSALQDAMASGGRNVAVTLEYTKSTN